MASKTKTCPNCGEPFTYVRSTKQFCSDRCKVAHNRAGLSGLDPDTIETIRYSYETYMEYKRWERQAIRKLDAEIRRIKRTTDVGDLDYEEKIEAAKRRFVRACHTWETPRLRERTATTGLE